MEKLLTSLITALVVIGVPWSAPGQVLIPPSTPVRSRSIATGAPIRRLSVDEAVSLALEQNVNIRVERLNPQIQDLSMARARTAWTPNLTATVDNGSLNVPTNTIFAGTLGKLRRDELGASIGWDQRLPWGASYKMAWDNARVRSNTLFDTPNPALSSALTASYVQPLARNFRIDSARRQMRITKTNREISDIEFKETVLPRWTPKTGH